MTDLPPYPDSGDEATTPTDRGSTTGARRWGRRLGIAVVALLVLAIVVLHLTGTIGPGSH